MGNSYPKDSVSVSAEMLSLLNSSLHELRTALYLSGVSGSWRLYDNMGVLSLKGETGLCYLSNPVRVQGSLRVIEPKRLEATILQATKYLAKFPYAIHSIEFIIVQNPVSAYVSVLQQGYMISSRLEANCVDIYLK